MKRGISSTGFTIVETMIVLAISGFIFVVVAITLGGKQNASKFSTSIQNVRSEIQQVGADVSNGYYPNMNNFQCTGSATNIVLVPITNGTAPEQGTNTACVFMGKAIQFKTQNTDPEEYRVFSITGYRGATSLANASAALITPTSLWSNMEDDSVSATLQNGLSVTKMIYVDGGAKAAIGAFAFMYSFGDSTGENGTGAPQVDVYALKSTDLNQDEITAANKIQNSLRNGGAVKNPTGGVQICFKSGSTANQYGLVTIGGGGRQLAVELAVKSVADCGI